MANETGQAPKDIIGFLDFYFVKKAPFQIPAAGREWLVQFGPWIAVVMLVLSLPLLLTLLGFRSTWSPFYPTYQYAYRYGFDTSGYWPLTLGTIVHFGLVGMALSGLFARKMSGWRLMFYAAVVRLLTALLSWAIIPGLVVALISFYLLFQIRTLYR